MTSLAKAHLTSCCYCLIIKWSVLFAHTKLKFGFPKCCVSCHYYANVWFRQTS